MGWVTGERPDNGVNPHNDHSARFVTGLYEATQSHAILWAPSGKGAGNIYIRKEIRLRQNSCKFYLVFAAYSCCDFETGLPLCGGRLNEWDEDYNKVLKLVVEEVNRLRAKGWK